MGRTATIQKTRSGSNQNNTNKFEQHNENNEQNAKDETVKKDKPKKSKEATEREQRMFISSIDPYDAPLKWWETEHVKYAINYPPVRWRLEKVMGTHVVRFTDHKYMILLGSNIQKYHEEQQKSRIDERKLSPPSIVSELLKVSYKTLTERVQQKIPNKIKLYV